MNKYIFSLLICITLILNISCSTTSGVEQGDQLYTGLKKIEYTGLISTKQTITTQAEVEAALDCEPNGALLGSSYVRTPFPVSLWIWNATHKYSSGVGHWICKTFGKAPVLMSWVNPTLRASVAQNTLRNHGYMRGTVSYDIITSKNPKKAKIAYKVNMGELYTIDSLEYLGFNDDNIRLIDSTKNEAYIRKGEAYDLSLLDAERTRLATLFRNNGYYYYQPAYASYLADTLQREGGVQLRMQLASNTPDIAQRRWIIGKVDLQLRREFMEELKDSFRIRDLTIRYNGRRPRIHPRVVLHDVKMRPGKEFRYQDYLDSYNTLSDMGLFSRIDLNFTPRDTTSNLQTDTLDLVISSVFDKPYSVYLETNYTGKSNGRMGPGLVVGMTKTNAFKRGETLDLNFNASYEWQVGRSSNSASNGINSYEYGVSGSLTFPRLMLPWSVKRRFYTSPKSSLKVASSVINRANYFKRHIVSGEITYNLPVSKTSTHSITPLSLQYNYMNSHTELFDSIINANSYLKATMRDVLIPKMKYTYTYSSPKKMTNPVWWQISVSEAGNIMSLGYVAAGEKWSEKNKEVFKNPFAQFLKFETEWSKKWMLNTKSSVVAHAAAGAVWSYGNSVSTPYSEQFFVGGANSIRAFSVRSLGPGGYTPTNTTDTYLDQTGDIKLLLNLEYRPHLIGGLYGAAFIDAGNVWLMHKDEDRPNGTMRLKSLLKNMAVGTGIGLRYDLDFFIIRVDWGIGLHLPYKTGFYNVGRFKDAQAINLAIGYPF